MTERPILFSSSMVCALLDGRKTQTRRVVKGEALNWLQKAEFTPEYVALPENDLCPYGMPGDRLWVRETWRLWDSRAYAGDGEPLDPDVVTGSLSTHSDEWLRSRPLDYAATNDDDGPWRPSIHMPRWASRITLEVTEVRVERLQDISEQDAIAEGVCLHDERSGWVNECEIAGKRHFGAGAVGLFAQLWDSLNAERGYGWDTNPWVWVLQFRRVL